MAPFSKTPSAGNDFLQGTNGAETLAGQGGNDFLLGNDGNDDLSGNAGIDVIFGGNGKDKLSGQQENDTLDGGADDDVVNGGGGNDLLSGSFGNDRLDGGAGANDLFGGDGADIFVLKSNGVCNIQDFQDGQDKIDLKSLAPAGTITPGSLDFDSSANGVDTEIRDASTNYVYGVVYGVADSSIDATDCIF